MAGKVDRAVEIWIARIADIGKVVEVQIADALERAKEFKSLERWIERYNWHC